ncbi:MAG: hypothetical protein VKJ09_15615, partial [Leptolyngbya sp.]|nr:hypothetical protein [Leptolyngbya sp.]
WVVPADLDPAVYSGRILLEKLRESGTGEEKLAAGYSVFPVDEDTGEILEDVPAVKVAKAMYRHPAVPDATKEKVKQFLEKGEYVPPSVKDTSVVARLASVPPLEKPYAKAAEKAADKPKVGKKGDAPDPVA